MFYIIGLENEGGRDRFARHAVGARFVDEVHRYANFGPWQQLRDVKVADGFIANQPTRLMVQTVGKLHHCGEVLTPHLQDVVIPGRIIVAYDEAGFDLGQLRMVTNQENWTGHLGVRNLVKELRTVSCAWLQLGIDSIPARPEEWEEFFNADLSPGQMSELQIAFEQSLLEVENYIGGFQTVIPEWVVPLPEDALLESQLPDRTTNLWLAPFAVRISKAEVEKLGRAVKGLRAILYRVASQYARLCDDNDNADQSPLVQLLESGVPSELVPLIRRTRFFIDHLGFDFQSGRLIEINPAPYPALILGRLQENLGLNIPGVTLTTEMLTERPRLLTNRMHRLTQSVGRKVLLINRVGDFDLGREGWLDHVRDYLIDEGYEVEIGKSSEDAQLIWANLTWMTPDRWENILVDRVWAQQTEVFPSPRAFLFTSKRFLAALSDPVGQEILGVVDQARFLDQVIPWTRVLHQGGGTVRLLLRNRFRLYGKPFLSSGGRGGAVINATSDLSKVQTPAVVQEWVDPYQLSESDLRYDVRICIYGSQGQHQVWQARVWQGSSTLQRPLDVPIVLG